MRIPELPKFQQPNHQPAQLSNHDPSHRSDVCAYLLIMELQKPNLCLPLGVMCNVIHVKIHLHIYYCRSNGITQQWFQNLFNRGASIWRLRVKLPWLNVMPFSRVRCSGIGITWGKHNSMARRMVKLPKSLWCQIYIRGTPCKAFI